MINSIKIGDTKISTNGYPKLMCCGYKNRIDLVILMTGDDKTDAQGTVVYSSSSRFPIGYYSDSWLLSDFDDYMGEITLKNAQ